MRIIDPSEFPAEIPSLVKDIILPHVIAIYQNDTQVGSAFLTMWNGKQLLVTAKHCLFGHGFDEDPDTRQVHVGGELVQLGDVTRSQVISTSDALDVSVVHVEGFEPARALSYTALKFGVSAPDVITVAGYLGRDFRRSKAESTLRPKPFCYTNRKKDLGAELVGVEYPNRAITTATGVRELSPVPRGLSGTLMVSSTALLLEKVEVYGIFTDERLNAAYVFGTHVDALPRLLQSLLEG